MKKLPILSRRDRLRIAVEAECDERSVAAVYAGHKTHATTRSCVTASAKKLKLPAPPEVK